MKNGNPHYITDGILRGSLAVILIVALCLVLFSVSYKIAIFFDNILHLTK